ncbi:MAG: outer membrane beta-barrel protein [Candidatus Sulfotelmatobacter sp.]|jgi:outer membrane immunogenic protein
MLKLRFIKTLPASLLLFGFTAVAALSARAQNGGSVDVGVDYNYVRTNAPAAGCGCFALNGGSAWLAFDFSPSIGIVAEIAGQHASNISSSGADLTLTSYLAGPRYTWAHARHFAPFAQLLLGGAHASGSLAPGSSALPGSANAFAMIAGGGLDISLTRRVSLRVFEADYYLTHFDNGVNDHQNNLRIAAGVIIRFGGSN